MSVLRLQVEGQSGMEQNRAMLVGLCLKSQWHAYFFLDVKVDNRKARTGQRISRKNVNGHVEDSKRSSRSSSWTNKSSISVSIMDDMMKVMIR